MYDFEVIKAKSLTEAVELLKSEGAQVLGGGQTLIPTLKQRLASPNILISVAHIPELAGVTKTDDNEIVIGGSTTHAEVNKKVKDFEALADLAGKIGDPAVRNRGTIGGSVANNDPSACYPAAVLASGAKIVTSSKNVCADDFFLGMFSTMLDEGEVITQINFPIPLRASYQKFDQLASRFALVGVFLARFSHGVRIAVTGASENGVFRWSQAEEALSKKFAVESLQDVNILSDEFINDIHGGADYRCHLIRVLTKRAVEACCD